MQKFEAIRRYGHSPIETEGVRYREIVNQERDNRVWSPEAFFKDLQRVFGWVSANPSDSSKVKLFQALFLLSDEGSIHKRPIGSVAQVVEEFTEFLQSGHQQFAQVLGRRGSGKTALTNYVLSVNHEALQKAHTTWLRADIAKLHAINEERFRHSPNSVIMTVDEYMAVHGFSVILSYGRTDTVFQPAFMDEADWPDNSESPFEKYLSTVDTNLASKWRLIRRTEKNRMAQVSQGMLKKEQDQDLKWYILKVSEGVTPDEARSLFRACWEFISKSYSNECGKRPRLILVFDGVDNLRTDEHAPKSMWLAKRSARDWYFVYLRELAHYLEGGAHCLPFDSCVFVIRDDTAEDLTALVNVAHQQEEMHEIVRFETACPDIEKMFKRKVRFARNSANHCGAAGQSIPKDERLEQFEWFYSEFCDAHIDILKRSLPMRVRSFSVRDVVDITFNGNIRSFSRNLIRTFAYLNRYAASHDDYNTLQSREDRLSFLRNSRHLVFEGSVLAGNHFMRLNFDQRAKGRWCPNVFQFEESTASRWDGLVLLRVLQSCPLSDSDQPAVVRSSLQRDLGFLGYDAHCVGVAIYTAIEFGLLCLGKMIRNPDHSTHELALFKTAKGGFIERFIFLQPSVLYLIATGATLAGTGGEFPERGSNPYIHRLNPPRFFSVSVIRTVALLCRHIISAHRRDMEYVVAKLANADVLAQIVDKDEFMSRFTSPPVEDVFRDLRAIVTHGNLHGSESSELNRIIAQWLDLENDTAGHAT